jgi:hypothetical protein
MSIMQQQQQQRSRVGSSSSERDGLISHPVPHLESTSVEELVNAGQGDTAFFNVKLMNCSRELMHHTTAPDLKLDPRKARKVFMYGPTTFKAL